MIQRDVDSWVEYTQSLHNREIDLTLDRVALVRDRLNLNPLPSASITVAGTNGKGSTVAMLESVYRTAGYRTLAYTSPHLIRYNERIRIDGKSVEDALLLESFETVEAAREDTPLTYFEFGTLVAAQVVKTSGIDIALLEVGLGGRLDAVRMLSSDISIITSIGIDHQAWLGLDRESIGREKAGIMHKGGKAVCAESDCPASVLTEARRQGVDLWLIGQEFGFDRRDDTSGRWRWWCKSDTEQMEIENLSPPGLAGRHQYYNAAGVVAVVERLQKTLSVSRDDLSKGLASTSLAGRLQAMYSNPICVFDVAHNVEAVIELKDFLKQNPVTGRTCVVLGMLEDKPVAEAVALLDGIADTWLAVGLSVERGIESGKLRQIIESEVDNAIVEEFDDPVSAWRRAQQIASDGDRIVVFGSFHTVGDILATL